MFLFALFLTNISIVWFKIDICSVFSHLIKDNYFNSTPIILEEVSQSTCNSVIVSGSDYSYTQIFFMSCSITTLCLDMDIPFLVFQGTSWVCGVQSQLFQKTLEIFLCFVWLPIFFLMIKLYLDLFILYFMSLNFSFKFSISLSFCTSEMSFRGAKIWTTERPQNTLSSRKP